MRRRQQPPRHPPARIRHAASVTSKAIPATQGPTPFAQALRLLASGKNEEGLALLLRLAEERPSDPEVQFQLANAYRALGRVDEAAAGFEKVIELNPGAVAAVYNLANARLEKGRLEEAAGYFRRALELRPDFAEAANNLGNVLRHWERTREAFACYVRAVLLKPDFPQALSNLGSVMRTLGRLPEAEGFLRRAILIQEDYPAAHNNLGNLLKTQGRLQEAVQHYTRAIRLKLEFPEAVSNLGATLRGLGRLDDAATCFDFAIALDPNYPDVHNNLGNLLQARGRGDEALTHYDRAIRLRPRFPEAINNRGTVLQAARQVDQAIDCYRAAIEIRKDYAEAHNNLGMALLGQGDFAEGWREYEWRWLIPEMINSRPSFPQPQWRGEPAAGKTILIHAEQGFGDTIQFCRYAPMVAARGLEVVLKVQHPLVRLMQGLPGVARVIGRNDPLPAFDLHCPMLSLPLAFGTGLETIPSAPAYLAADPAESRRWRERLPDLAGGLKVGLVWAGNPRRHSVDLAAIDRRRSMAPELLAPLFDVAGVSFFSLQKDGPRPPSTLPMIDLMDQVGDFADTAALIDNLDLVISVDTAVAHLAAAIGKPVWVMDRFDSCWRWLEGREDTPWYPRLRLFHQTTPADWAEVVRRVARALSAEAGKTCLAEACEPPFASSCHYSAVADEDWRRSSVSGSSH